MDVQVSVIIPIYNVEKYLKQCLDSVLKQSFQNIEIIAVNDGSQDSSGDILSEYCKKYPNKIREIHQENQGLSAARNAALDIARGEYLAFVDSDDYIGEEYIQNLYEKAVESESDMVICNYTKVSESGEVLKVYEANYMEGEMRIPSYISCNRIIRRELLEKYHIRYKKGIICEDMPVMLKMEAIAKNIQIIPMNDYFYRTNPKSITSTFKKRKLRMDQLPFDALGESVEFCMKHSSAISYEKLEFFLCRIWTSMIFDIGRGCDMSVRRAMCKEVIAFMKRYFPQYYKNPYVRPNALSHLPMIQKWGTWIFVLSLRLNLIKTIAFLLSWI